MFFGKKNALLCIATGFLSVLHNRGITRCYSQQAQGHAHAADPCGKWAIVQSNDPLVEALPGPRVVDIVPGSFRIGAKVFGSFDLLPDPPKGEPKGVYVSMTMYNIGLFKRVYNMVPLDPHRLALFGVGKRRQVYYILERIVKKPPAPKHGYDPLLPYLPR